MVSFLFTLYFRLAALLILFEAFISSVFYCFSINTDYDNKIIYFFLVYELDLC